MPEWYRIVLKSIRKKSDSGVICSAMGSYAAGQVLDWLDELETLGFIEVVESASSLPSPDITGRFSLHSLRVQRHAA